MDREQSEEDMRMRQVSTDEMERLIGNGEIKNGPTIAAYYLFLKNKD